MGENDDDATYSITAKGLIYLALRDDNLTDAVWGALVEYGKRFAAAGGHERAGVLLDDVGGRIVPLGKRGV